MFGEPALPSRRRRVLAQALELAFEALPQPVSALGRLDQGLRERRGQAVAEAVEACLAGLARADIAGASWDAHGAIILLPDFDAAPALIDRVAPEHLELALADPDALAARVRNAGAIFLGRHTPEALGDYLAGPNHVLPTARSARFSSGLSVLDFMKRSSLIACTPEGLKRLGPAVIALARAEGLEAHALSVAIRLDDSQGD